MPRWPLSEDRVCHGEHSCATAEATRKPGRSCPARTKIRRPAALGVLPHRDDIDASLERHATACSREGYRQCVHARRQWVAQEAVIDEPRPVRSLLAWQDVRVHGLAVETI